MGQVMQALETLAEKLGVSVEYLWPLLVHKTVMDWWALLGVGLFSCGVGVVLSLWARKLWAALDDPIRDGKPTLVTAVAVFSLISGAIMLVVSVMTVSNVLVPEAATVERLIGSLG